MFAGQITILIPENPSIFLVTPPGLQIFSHGFPLGFPTSHGFSHGFPMENSWGSSWQMSWSLVTSDALDRPLDAAQPAGMNPSATGRKALGVDDYSA